MDAMTIASAHLVDVCSMGQAELVVCEVDCSGVYIHTYIHTQKLSSIHTVCCINTCKGNTQRYKAYT